MDSHGADVGGAELHRSNFLIDAQDVRGDITIAEMGIEADARE